MGRQQLLKVYRKITFKKIFIVVVELSKPLVKPLAYIYNFSLSSRRRRAANYITFTEDQVHLLPGYPKQISTVPLLASLAFYLQFPPGSSSTVVMKDVLVSIVQGSLATISSSINANITSVQVVVVDTTTTPSTTTSAPTLKPTKKDDSKKISYIIGGCVAGAVVLIVVVIAVVWCCKRKNANGYLIAMFVTVH